MHLSLCSYEKVTLKLENNLKREAQPYWFSIQNFIMICSIDVANDCEIGRGQRSPSSLAWGWLGTTFPILFSLKAKICAYKLVILMDAPYFHRCSYFLMYASAFSWMHDHASTPSLCFYFLNDGPCMTPRSRESNTKPLTRGFPLT